MADKISTPFLGKIAEVCIVTSDCEKTMDGLLKLGIGPFKVFEFNSSTVQDRHYYGKESKFELRVCFANQEDLVIEIMQPIGEASLMSEYLEQRRGQEGIQHIAFDCKDIPMNDRKLKMLERGFAPAMEGKWIGKKGLCHFCFFDTEASTGMVMESIEFSEDWEDPEFILYPSTEV